jgi:Xaa-Pro dipeptidase
MDKSASAVGAENVQHASLQRFMREQGIDAWVVYDFRGSSSVLPRLLPRTPAAADGGSAGRRWTTRRVLLAIPASGPSTLLVHAIDASQFRDLANAPGMEVREYLGWKELHAELRAVIQQMGSTLAMDYSPGAALPVVSQADAGTVELVRELGARVVSSADLIQHAIARWDQEGAASHMRASVHTGEIMAAAWGLIRERLGARTPVSERDVQLFILDQFERRGLTAGSDAPVVATNAHAADPHFEVPAQGSAQVTPGDWVLIDLWAREKVGTGHAGTREQDAKLYSDITWTGFAGAPGQLAERRREVFEAVRDARDAAVSLAISAHQHSQLTTGWQLDEAASSVLKARGLEKFIRHRTGHSLSPGAMVHGMGVNLDNIETHDTRLVLPGVGWTVEPGAYLAPGLAGVQASESFGVRNEINMWFDPERGPAITSCVQDEPVWLM